MGLLRNMRDRFLPPTNRAYRRLTEATNSEVAALRSQVEQLGVKIDALGTELKETRAQVAPMASGVKRLASSQERGQGAILSTLDYVTLATRALGDARGTVLLAGWYCAGNSGDELMLKTVISYSPASMRDNIYVLAWNNNPDFDPEPLNDLGVHVIRYPTTTREVDLLASSIDVLVWGGGAILDDVQYDSRPDNFNTGNLFIRLSEILIARDRPVYAIGLSSNDSLTSPAYLSRLQRVIDGSRAFTLRDQTSYDVLREAGIDMQRVGRCEDIAFASNALRGPGTLGLHRGGAIGFVPFYIREMHEVNVSILDDILGLVAGDDHARVMLIPFYARGDVAYLPKLRDACSNPDRVEIATFADDISESPMYECGHLIISRYHAALMASVASIPYVCVIPDMHRHYGNKLGYLARLCDYEGHFVNASEWGDARRGMGLLAQMLEETDGAHVPDRVVADTQKMLQDVWTDICSQLHA